MAYLDLEYRLGATIAPTRATPAELAQLEKQVVFLSRNEELSSVRPKRKLDPILHKMFGIEPVRGLANERLEALRRYAVLRRIHGDRMNILEHDRALAADLAASTLARVRELVDPWRTKTEGHKDIRQLFAINLLFAVGLLLFPMVADATGDGMIAVILLGVALVGALSVFLSTERRP